MQRRTYLALTSSICLAGCTTSRNAGPSTGDGSNSSTDPKSSPESDPGTRPADGAEPIETIDDFESLDSWETVGGTFAPDPSRSVVGTQSARFEIPTDERNGAIATTFSEPLDLSDAVPGLAVAADDLVVPWLRLVDDDGNEFDYRRGIKGGLPLERYNFGVESAPSAFDHAAVRKIYVMIWAGDGSQTVWLDDLHLVARPETGKVMIQFDDAHVTDYTKALPMLEEYGYPAVTFVNPERIEAETRGADDPGGFPRLTVDQVHELHDAGWVIGNHCYSHAELPTLDAAAQKSEISRGKDWLETEGFEEGAQYFAYPFGAYDERTLDLVEQHHDIGFAGGRPVQGYAVNPQQTSRIGDPGVEQARTAIERTASMRGITSLFFHRLEGEVLAAFEATIEAIREYETAGEIDVILPADLERMLVS